MIYAFTRPSDENPLRKEVMRLRSRHLPNAGTTRIYVTLFERPGANPLISKGSIDFADSGAARDWMFKQWEALVAIGWTPR